MAAHSGVILIAVVNPLIDCIRRPTAVYVDDNFAFDTGPIASSVDIGRMNILQCKRCVAQNHIRPR